MYLDCRIPFKTIKARLSKENVCIHWISPPPTPACVFTVRLEKYFSRGKRSGLEKRAQMATVVLKNEGGGWNSIISHPGTLLTGNWQKWTLGGLKSHRRVSRDTLLVVNQSKWTLGGLEINADGKQSTKMDTGKGNTFHNDLKNSNYMEFRNLL